MPARTGEDWSAGISASFAEPWAQGRHGVAGQRDGPFLTSLAEDLDVRAAAEGDVGVAHCRQLRDPQAGLHGEGEQGPVALRSEERRVGKECRSRWSPYQ